MNSIFFGGAFLSFMAVAAVPAILEDRAAFVKEHNNGLYGASAVVISNTLTSMPWLFLISLMFSTIVYWLSNFRPSGTGFMVFVAWLWMDLLAAEALVVLVTSLLPGFVLALAATAFANGLFMSVNGFMVATPVLNVFYRYVFHYIDYQAYVSRYASLKINANLSRSIEP
jgi:ABC-type multidrug transport system permease subunit